MITYAVIPSAGLGTRLLPVTKGTPKEMLPLPIYHNGSVHLYPVIHIIFERLYNIGVRNFCFVISPKKMAIKRYFTPDYTYLEMLREDEKEGEADILERFYRHVERSDISFKIQDEPLGVGDAVLRGAEYVRENSFIINMGDDLLLKGEEDPYKVMTSIFEEREADCVLIIKRVEDPKPYGVVRGKPIEEGLYRVEEIIEKPDKPVSNLAILGIYTLKPIIFSIMDRLKEDEEGWELTDAVQRLIDGGGEVLAYRVDDNVKRIDIGRSDNYIGAYRERIEAEKLY
jgi:UTP--glucose-1-phosphate uridylyltransferase